MNRINIFQNTAIVFILLQFMGCLSFFQTSKKNIETLLHNTNKNITTAELLEDQKKKNKLLAETYKQLREAESISKEKKILFKEVAKGFALYYYTTEDYVQAQKYSKIAMKHDGKDIELSVLNICISLKEKGKLYAPEAISKLKVIIIKSPGMALAELTIGDSYFLIDDFDEARKQYEKVMIIGGVYQVKASNRLEMLDKINRIGNITRNLHEMLLKKYVKREDISDLLNRVLEIRKYLKFGKRIKSDFIDISKSRYDESIRDLRDRGFFSYIQGDLFEPFKLLSRGEMAAIVEDFIVLTKGDATIRKRYLKDSNSRFKGVTTDNPWYNAIRIAVENKIIHPSLDGSIDPDEHMSSIDIIIAMKKMIRKVSPKPIKSHKRKK
ncbi:MAG: hypothetical protein SVR08_01095 [Spirochaetota bacterium]|nr:hypothetical protein [Spirochaetota bacterium]